MTTPALSVIVACYNARGTIVRCLEALSRQDCTDFEIIVVDSSTDGTANLVAEHFPRVRLLREKMRRYPGDARNIGVRSAAADILAFTDADAVAAPDWVGKLLKAHRDPAPLIGGSVGVANPQRLVSWAAYFCEFSNVMPAGLPRHGVETPTVCFSMKRRLFEQYGPFLEGSYCSDTAFQWHAIEGGYPTLFLPEVRVDHINIDHLRRFVCKQYMHGRTFAQVRVRTRRLPKWQVMLLMAGAPLLPGLLVWRIARNVLQARMWRMRFAVASPLVLLGMTAWSAGECAGYAHMLKECLPADGA